MGLPPELADNPYSVRREVCGQNSRIDIEVAARGRFLIHIEVKIAAPEGANQTHREWEDLQRHAAELGVSEDAKNGGVFALYLTPSGRLPGQEKVRPVRWTQIACVLERFASQAQPAEVKLFASHYARTLRRYIIDLETEEREVNRA